MISLWKVLEIIRGRNWIDLLRSFIVGAASFLLHEHHKVQAILVSLKSVKAPGSGIFRPNPFLKSAASNVIGASGRGGGDFLGLYGAPTNRARSSPNRVTYSPTLDTKVLSMVRVR